MKNTCRSLERTARNGLRLAAVALACSGAGLAQAAIQLQPGQLSYAQFFDVLPNVNGSDPVWTNNGTMPGWYIFSGPQLDTPVSNLRVSTSSGSDRAHISYGINGASDRAFGSQAGSSHRYSSVTPGDGEAFGAILVAFTNASGEVMDGFSFSYTGEQWHVSSNANTAHSLTMGWALGNNPPQSLSWNSFSAAQAAPAGVNFVSPTIAGGTTGNGNLAANRTVGLGASVSGLQWLPGETLWLRWVDINDPASDHGLAIDDFSFTASVVPEPQTALLALGGVLGLGAWLRRRRGL